MARLSAKSWMPRSLYGRAALILIVPVVTLQLVVSVVFIQRHFEGVTEQMTRSISREMLFVQDIATGAADAEAVRAALVPVARALDLQVNLPSDPPETDSRAFYDVSGRRVIATLRETLPTLVTVDLAASIREVRLWLDTPHGPLGVVIDRRRVSASNPHQLLVLMVVTGVLMTLIAAVFLRNQLRPIKRLARASEDFGKGRTTPYRPSGATEVRAAGQAFLDMRNRIERQIEQRTMLLSGVSHDLRTPLTRMKLSLSLMDEGPETAELERDLAEMERLLDEFLAFVRDDAHDDPEPCDPVEILRQIVARNPGAEMGEITGEGAARLRPVAFTRAVENLVGNALRYGNRARVSVALSDRAVRVVVEDDGPGIPAEKRAEALKPFVRLDRARNQDRGGGVGLGLAITNDIARRHGGQLVLGESVALGGLRADLVLAR